MPTVTRAAATIGTAASSGFAGAIVYFILLFFDRQGAPLPDSAGPMIMIIITSLAGFFVHHFMARLTEDGEALHQFALASIKSRTPPPPAAEPFPRSAAGRLPDDQ